MVRREIQKALAEEQVKTGITQASIANDLGVNRSVIHRQIMGLENLTLGTVGEIASALGRDPQFSMPPLSPVGSNHGPVQAGTNPDPRVLATT